MTAPPPIRELKAFTEGRTDVQAVLQRAGRATFDLGALAAAAELGTPVAEGWTEDLARRMNRRDHWNEPGGQKRAL